MQNWPSRRFYEALGARLVEERQILDAGDPFDMAIYGWDDIGPLAAAAGRAML